MHLLIISVEVRQCFYVVLTQLHSYQNEGKKGRLIDPS